MSRSGVGGLTPFAPVAAVWLSVAIIDFALSAAITGSALRSSELPLAAGVTLAACDVLLLAVVIGPLAALRRAAGAWAWPVIAAAVFLYTISWAAFWNAGVFIDRAAFLFWAPHPIQVFHWVYPPLAAGILVVTAIAAVALGRLVPRLAAAMPITAQRRLVLTAMAAAAVCVVVAGAGALAYGGGSVGDAPSAYAVARDQRGGPALRVVADLRNTLARADDPVPVAAGGPVTPGRGIISMDQYVAGIDRGRVKRWNVLMVQIESLRSDQLRAYGGRREVMPTVDRLARESRVFTNAYIQASHSNYADLVPLSSHYPLRSREMYVYPPNPTYPRVLIYDILKAVGYKTAIISSQNEGWGGMINFHRRSSLDHLFHAATYDGPTYSPFEDGGFANWVKQTGGAGSVDDRYTVDEAITWLDTVGQAPFFLHMNLQSSHLPYVVPDGFPRRFGPNEIDFAIMWGKFPLDKVDVVKDRYADSLYYEDTQIARVFEHLRQRGLWDNTLVVIGGDNGESFYEHGAAAHAATVFEEVVKVPMIVRVPGMPPGADGRPAMFLDIPPSLVDVLGLPPHPSFQGISLFAPESDPERPMFTIVQTPVADQSAIIRGRYKLILSETDQRSYLYDLRKEGEYRNIRNENPALVAELLAVLRTWRDSQLAYYADPQRHRREYPPRPD